MNYIDRIDKEAGLIKLTIGQICSAGTGHNIYTGDHKHYATPFMHTVWENDKLGLIDGRSKDVGYAIRIANNGEIISNPSYRGNAIIAFLDPAYTRMKIHTCRITKINKHSVNIVPVEYKIDIKYCTEEIMRVLKWELSRKLRTLGRGEV